MIRPHQIGTSECGTWQGTHECPYGSLERDRGESLTDTDCFVCGKHALGMAVPGGIIYEDDLVYAGHILPPDPLDVYLGYLMVEPKRHVTGLGELTDGEATALGLLVNNLGQRLKTARAQSTSTASCSGTKCRTFTSTSSLATRTRLASTGVSE